MKAKARRTPRDKWHVVEVIDTMTKESKSSGTVTYIKCYINSEEWWLGPGLYYPLPNGKEPVDPQLPASDVIHLPESDPDAAWFDDIITPKEGRPAMGKQQPRHICHDTFALWPKYLRHVDKQNRKIAGRNNATWENFRATQAKQRARLEASEKKMQARYEADLEAFEASQKAWDDQPLYKRFTGPERPWLGPIRPHMMSQLLLGEFPLLEPYMQPTIEDYLTWHTKQGRTK